MNRTAIIVSHGQPSDPDPVARELAEQAARVSQQLPGWIVKSATLAEPRALANAAGAMPPGVIFPMFMAGGWFARVQIPARLAEAAVTGWKVLEPFGCEPTVHDLAREIVAEADGEDVLLAAHGSFKSSVPSDIAHHVVQLLRPARPNNRVEAAFIDQAPRLSDARGFGVRSLCLPFFAAAGAHVTEDIPKLLTKAGFQGRILPPLGLDQRVPGIIAAAILAGRELCVGECRWRK